MPRPPLLVAILAIVLVPQHTPPPVPFVNEGACPFECCTYRDWIATTDVGAHPRWRATTTTTTPDRVLFSVKAGETVTAMTGVVVTTKLGQIKVLAPATVYSDSPSASQLIELGRDEIVYLLTPHGESAYTAWVKGRLVDTLRTEDLLADRKAKVVEQPRIDWWVKIRNARGQIGWTNRPQDFRNKDACGAPDAQHPRSFHELAAAVALPPPEKTSQ